MSTSQLRGAAESLDVDVDRAAVRAGEEGCAESAGAGEPRARRVVGDDLGVDSRGIDHGEAVAQLHEAALSARGERGRGERVGAVERELADDLVGAARVDLVDRQ